MSLYVKVPFYQQIIKN